MFSNRLNNVLGVSQTITSQSILEIEELLISDSNLLNVVPAERLSKFTQKQIQYFCMRYGFYSIPTKETIDFIKEEIGEHQKVIEIGSGNGVYARELDIIGTDNFMQDPRKAAKFSGVADEYAKNGQEVVPYGDNVQEYDGRDAVRKFKAEVVVCSWVTHKYNRTKHHLGGNMYGVDFNWILDRAHVKKVIMVGNKTVHKNNPIMERPHREYTLDGALISRASIPDDNRIFVWDC